MSLDKKQLKTAYRDRPLDAGILLVSFAGSDQQFLVPARDIKSTQNRLRFMLELQNCTYKDLQAAWDTCGAQNLRFELAESYRLSDDADNAAGSGAGDAAGDAARIEEDLRTLLHLVAQEHPKAIVLEPARL
jgi:hypothetical protein